MRQSSYRKSQSIKSSTISPIFTGAMILALIISLFLNPNLLASAETSNEERPSLSHNTYIPIALKTSGAYYVSPKGDDTNPGTSLRPWKTFGKAASVVQPGDTVYIRAGIYNESVYFRTSGTASSPIKILAYPGENPIMDGYNTIPEIGGSLLRIVGDYIYASGIEIRNSAYEGIRVQGNYDVVANMFVHNSRSNGITIIHGHNSTAEYNRIWRNSLVNEYGRGANWGAGMSAIHEGVSYATIRHNMVWENWGEGISSSSADHTVIEDNIIHDNFSANIYITSSTNVLSQRNFVYTDPTSYVYQYGEHSGILMGDEHNEVDDFQSANITIINNIVFDNYCNFWWYGDGQNDKMVNVLISNNTFVNSIGHSGIDIHQGQHQNVRFMNNIIQQDDSLYILLGDANPELHFSNNLWSKTPPSFASGPGDIIGDPLLAHTGDPYLPEWYTLTGISPAIDGAQSLSEVVVDYFGINREAPPDVGANEFFPNP